MLLKDYISQNYKSIADFSRVHHAKRPNMQHRVDSGFIISGKLIYSPKHLISVSEKDSTLPPELASSWIERNYGSQYALAKDSEYSKQQIGKWVKDGWVVWKGRVYSPRMKINSDNTLSIKGRLVRK